VELIKPVNFRKIGTRMSVLPGIAETWVAQKKARLVPHPDVPRAAEKMVPQGRRERMTRKG